MEEQPLKFEIFFKIFEKLKILILWRINTAENSKEFIYQQLNEFLNSKVINYYYKNI